MDTEQEPAGAGLAVRGLRKRFGDVVALDGVDLRVRPGQLVGFLGPNGAGKTTTMRAIMRLVSTDGGTITYGGRPVGERQRRRIGYMPQERGLYMRMRAHDHVAYVGRLAGMRSATAAAAADRWLERVGLADRGHDPVESLSSGNQQRIQLVVALVHDPDLLILDEPFRGLDPVAARTLAALLTERAASGAGVVFSSHQLDLVQDLCEDVTIVSDGVTVATGKVAELRARAAWRVVRITWEDPEVRWTPPPALRGRAAGGSGVRRRWGGPVRRRGRGSGSGRGGGAGPGAVRGSGRIRPGGDRRSRRRGRPGVVDLRRAADAGGAVRGPRHRPPGRPWVATADPGRRCGCVRGWSARSPAARSRYSSGPAPGASPRCSSWS